MINGMLTRTSMNYNQNTLSPSRRSVLSEKGIEPRRTEIQLFIRWKRIDNNKQLFSNIQLLKAKPPRKL